MNASGINKMQRSNAYNIYLIENIKILFGYY